MTKNNDSLAGYVLLDSMNYSLEEFQVQFHDDWKIEIEGTPAMGQFHFCFGDVTIAMLVMPKQLPEAIQGCSMNHSWGNCLEKVSAHEAYVEFAVLDCPDPLRRNVLFTMVASSLMKQENVIGLYRYPTVEEASYYMEQAEVMKKDLLPVILWIYVGLYQDEQGCMNLYTYGMEEFGCPDLEIRGIDPRGAGERASLLGSVWTLWSLMTRVIRHNRPLKDGETIQIVDTVASGNFETELHLPLFPEDDPQEQLPLAVKENLMEYEGYDPAEEYQIRVTDAVRWNLTEAASTVFEGTVLVLEQEKNQ